MRNEWKILEKLIVLLETFFRVHQKLSYDSTAMSVVLPNTIALDHFLSKIGENDQRIQTTKVSLRENLKTRFLADGTSILGSKLHLISTARDSRYKTSFFKDVEVSEKAKGYIIQECMNMPSFEGEPPIGAEIPAKAPKSSLESCMAEISGNRVFYSQNQDSLELELNRFLAERCANENCNSYTWWKNSSSFPKCCSRSFFPPHHRPSTRKDYFPNTETFMKKQEVACCQKTAKNFYFSIII